jgi:hypothetical protein
MFIKLMHVEYRVDHRNHDWVVAGRHKLIPSVYAGIHTVLVGFGNKQAAGCSGSTYTVVRSRKDFLSTALSHGLDLEMLLNLKAFEAITMNGTVRSVNPVFVSTVDGGPDKDPRY